MKKYRVGLIRVLTTDDPQLKQMHGALIEQYFPMLQVESRCIPDQPEGIHDDQTMATGVPKVVAMAKEMWQEGRRCASASGCPHPGHRGRREHRSSMHVLWQPPRRAGNY